MREPPELTRLRETLPRTHAIAVVAEQNRRPIATAEMVVAGITMYDGRGDHVPGNREVIVAGTQVRDNLVDGCQVKRLEVASLRKWFYGCPNIVLIKLPLDLPRALTRAGVAAGGCGGWAASAHSSPRRLSASFRARCSSGRWHRLRAICKTASPVPLNPLARLSHRRGTRFRPAPT